MAIVQNKNGSVPAGVTTATDQKLCSNNRTAANVAGVVALTPLYPGEIVMALDTGVRYRGLSLVAGSWGQVTGELNI